MLKVEKHTETPLKASFKLRDLEVSPCTILSPMDGVTNIPFRRLCRTLAKERIGLLVSEFVPTDGDAKFSIESHPQLKFHPDERPFGIQIFGRFPEKMSYAAQKIQDTLHPDFIEINAGCPAPRVAGKGSGSGLLKDLPRLKEIIQEVKKAIEIPLTLKCRIGWDNTQINALETLKIAENEGVELMVLHGRTRVQGYHGLANWDIIGAVSEKAKIPIIGNGDVNSVQFALEKMNTYHIAGVSIGRGSMHNPWIFGQIADAFEGKQETKISAKEALQIFKIYAPFMREEGMNELRILGRLKQLGARLCKAFEPDGFNIRAKLLTSENTDVFFERLDEILLQAENFSFNPDKLINLNGAKQTDLVFGAQFK